MPRFYRSWLFSASALAMGVLAASAMSSGPARAAPKAQTEDWGRLPTGQQVRAVTLSNDHAMRVRILSYGGILQSVEVPDRNGKVEDVTLGFPSLEGYVSHNADPHFGAILGRVANRVAHGTFSIGGTTYHLPTNDGPNTLHGGPDSFDRKIWEIVDTGSDQSGAHVTLRMTSPDGDEGFPGNLTTIATYTLDQDNNLELRLQAKTDAPTVLNLSTHAYWNLNGEGSGTIEPEILQIFADNYTPTDALSIPTGKIEPVSGTAFDFRKPRVIGEFLRSNDPQMLWPRGYDKNWVLNSTSGAVPRLAVRLSDPRSGRVMEILTTQPGLQFYTSNSLDGRYVGPAGRAYRQGDAVAFEPQHFPDSPNQPDFPSVELKPGQGYDYMTVFHFSTEK